MQIGAHRNVIILLAASSTVFAQSVDSLVKSQNPLSIPDVRQIVASSIAATQRDWRVGLQYTYMERDEDRRLDMEGHVKSDHVDVSRTILVDGVPFEQLVERNGQPPRRRTSTKRKRSSTS